MASLALSHSTVKRVLRYEEGGSHRRIKDSAETELLCASGSPSFFGSILAKSFLGRSTENVAHLHHCLAIGPASIYHVEVDSGPADADLPCKLLDRPASFSEERAKPLVDVIKIFCHASTRRQISISQIKNHRI